MVETFEEALEENTPKPREVAPMKRYFIHIPEQTIETTAPDDESAIRLMHDEYGIACPDKLTDENGREVA